MGMVPAKPPNKVEQERLRLYHRVLTPSNEDAAALRELGVPSVFMPPRPDELGILTQPLMRGRSAGLRRSSAAWR